MLDTLQRPGDYVQGQFLKTSSPDDSLRILSPGDQADVVSEHDVSLSHVDRAVTAARDAGPAWRKLGIEERRALLRKYQERCRVHEDAIAETIARESGKPLWDSRGEAKALAGKVDLMLGEGATYTADKELEDLPGAIRHRALGVVAVIGPFNFPAHLANGQMVPALLHGNTIVFKPSEKTPSAAFYMARCFDEAGFPPGVVNIVQGAAASAKALVDHEEVDAILFTGSVAVGKLILAANAHRPGRMIALELGGKNASIVLDDADLDRAVNQISFAAFASAGQRCTATSRVYATAGVIDELGKRLAAQAAKVRVGHPLDDVFMGPLIDERSRTALGDAVARAREAGYVALESGGAFELDGRSGWYVRPSVHRAPSGDARVDGYSHDELFGPDVAIYPITDLDEGIERANGTRYGLAAALFTAERAAFDDAASRLRAGVCHWNQSTAGASGRLPFGGIGDSGNHRSAGILAGRFCAWPQAVRFEPAKDSPLPTWPGFGGE
ncbi:MAG: aldehyde dehydrogenase family protein [Polyangiales bacterium]